MGRELVKIFQMVGSVFWWSYVTVFLMDRAEIWICCGQGWGSTFLLNVKGGAGARFGRHEPAKMGKNL